MSVEIVKFPKTWLKEWKKDVKELETQLRALKAKLYTNWALAYTMTGKDFPGYDQYDALKLKFTLTYLYQYRAANRGKVHAEAMPAAKFGLKIPDTTKYDKLKSDAAEAYKQRQTPSLEARLS